MKGIGKGAVLDSFYVLFRNTRGETKRNDKTRVSIAGLRVEMREKGLPNMMQECYTLNLSVPWKTALYLFSYGTQFESLSGVSYSGRDFS
jgi:hypothetical protein